MKKTIFRPIFSLFLIAFLFSGIVAVLPHSAHAQTAECFDGKDNDGDGKIDNGTKGYDGTPLFPGDPECLAGKQCENGLTAQPCTPSASSNTGAGPSDPNNPGTAKPSDPNNPGVTNPSAGTQSTDLPLKIKLNNPLKVDNIQDAIKLFMDAVVKIAIPFIVVFFIWAGLQFILAQGNSVKIGKAKMMFWYTIIGTLLILGAWAITDAIVGTVNSIAS